MMVHECDMNERGSKNSKDVEDRLCLMHDSKIEGIYSTGLRYQEKMLSETPSLKVEY